MMRNLCRGGDDRNKVSQLELSSALWPKHHTLEQETVTERERELLNCLCQGLSNKEIARELGLSPNTVRNYLQRLQERFEIRNRVQLALLAQERGYI